MSPVLVPIGKNLLFRVHSFKISSMSTDLPSQIQSEIAELDVEKQRQVLEYLRGLKLSPQGMTGAELRKFAGTLSKVDAEEMIAAIESGCAQVDPHGW